MRPDDERCLTLRGFSVLEVTEFLYAIGLAACNRKEKGRGETAGIGVLVKSGREARMT
jgi:hypothetical protein